MRKRRDNSAPSREDEHEYNHHNDENDAGIELSSFQSNNNNNDDEHDQDEVTGLVTSESLVGREEEYDDDDDRICSGSFLTLASVMLCILLVASAPLFIAYISNKMTDIPVTYTCPNVQDIAKAENQDPTFQQEFVEQSLISANMTEFLDTYMQSTFDNWGKTYETMKEDMKAWKSKYFTHFLHNGDSIYESACGIGLNLFMTLEILQEQGIEHLFVYGNEYMELSVDKANAIFDTIPPAKAKKGMICPGDSTNLHFVPSNSFDLVFTGYITPLLDPLRFDPSSSMNLQDTLSRYIILCESNERDWQGQTLSRLAQKRQNEWYGKWVAEMARIAKPGAPVIVEQVSSQFCNAYFDWGGVSKTWWYGAARNNTYGWNVKLNSLIIEDDDLFRDRYHVFMLKETEEEEEGRHLP